MKRMAWQAVWAVAAAAATIAGPRAWGKTATVDGVEWSYSVANNAATVTGANPASGHLDIPSKLGGYGVKAIGDNAFYWCEGLTGVTIPSGVTSIGNYAFSGCSSLTEVTIPEGVKTLGEWSFYWCWRLPQATLPSSVTSIGEYAFSGCQSLTEMTIPENVASIGDYAFNSCTGLTAIAVSAGNSRFASVDGILYNKNKDKLLSCPSGKTSALSIPVTVKTIVDGAFSECGRLTAVEIPYGVTNIGTAAFLCCSNLVTATLPDSVRRIGESAFAGCGRLTGMALPSLLTSIGERAFSECDALTEMTIPSGVTSIGNYAFAQCGRLPAISVASGNSKFAGVDGILYNKTKDKLLACPGGKTRATSIPGTVKSVSAGAFFKCTNLVEVAIPDSVTSFGESAFEGCERLKSVVLPKNLTTIASRLFCRCFGLESVTIPNTVTAIEPWSFNSCGSLQSLALPNKLKSIGHKAFEYCSGLTELTIPDSVTSVGVWAFDLCSGLTSLHIGSGLSKIDEGVFNDCWGLTEIDIPNNVKTIGTSAFSSCYGLTAVTIPASVTSMGEYAFGWCRNLERFEVAAGNGNFASVDGVLYTKSKDRLLSWPAGKRGICVIPDGVKTIDERAFEECQGLTAVTMPDSLKNIGDVAFADCWNLAAVAVGNGVTNIGMLAFSGCNKLTALALPSSVKCVGDSAFGWGCALETLYVPASWEGTSMLSEASLPANCRVVYGANMQQVVFDPNGGTCDVASIWTAPGNPYGALPAAERTNQAFAGWHTAAEGGTEVEPEDAATSSSSRLLYAHWTNDQIVSFDPNGGTCDTATQTYRIGEAYGTLPTPEKGTCPFLGWFTAKSGGEQVAADAPVPVTAVRTLYAHWAKKQTVTFDANGGTCATATKTYWAPGTYGTLPNATREGNAFLGWYTAAAGGTKVKAGSSTGNASSRTLYAHWTAQQTVTFNANGGTCGTASGVFGIGGPYGALPVAAKADGVFAGWWTAASGGTRVTESSVVAAKATQTLYAHWTTQQTVTFDANGGTTPVASKSCKIGGTYGTLPTPAWAGHAYQGWWTAAEGGKRVYASGAVTAEAERTLYAHWTTRQTVTFNANGGTCGTATGAYEIGSPYGALPVAAKAGAVFGGWWTAASGGTRVREGSEVGEKASLTLYARWTTDQTVFFDANGGMTPVETKVRPMGDAYGTLPTPTREGYAYQGWWTAAEGGKRVYASGVVTAEAERTLYAHWTTQQTVTFNANGGTCGTATGVYEIGSPYGVLPVASKAGTVFGGWWTAASGGTRVRESSEVGTKASLTLYAHWTNEQTVTFDPNGGTTPVASKVRPIGDTYGSLPTPAREGYAYQGWWTAAEGGKRVYASGVVTAEAERTLYAHWRPTKQTVAFDANGGTCSTGSKVVDVGGTYGTMPVPKREGYAYKGWWTAPEGGKRVYAGDEVPEAAERTLYAHWVASKGLSISRFAVKGAAPGIRAAAGGGAILTFEAEAGCTYELQWTSSLDGEWMAVRSWTAEADGEMSVEVTGFSGEATGFYRLSTSAASEE